MKILLIDDDPRLAQSIIEYLGDWQLQHADNGHDGAELATGGGFDVILLDLNLPDISGHEVCRQIRRAGINTPILVLTGFTEINSKVSLLRSGADDYVTKPFDGQELQARLSALLRRGHLDKSGPHLLKADDLVLDPHKRLVERGGHKISLRRKEFDILEYLLRNKGRVVNREMIMDNVWDPDSESWNNTIDVHIKSLRDKVDRPFTHPLIRTAYGVGYKIDEKSSQQIINQERRRT